MLSGYITTLLALMQVHVYKNTKYLISLDCKSVLQIYRINQWKMELPLLRSSGSLATAWESWNARWSRVWRGHGAMKLFLYWQQISVYTTYLATLSVDILHAHRMTATIKWTREHNSVIPLWPTMYSVVKPDTTYCNLVSAFWRICCISVTVVPAVKRCWNAICPLSNTCNE